MEIILQIVLLVIGFVMLVKGADWFVEGASAIADRFGIPQIIIGLTIVAFGTSAPEAAISISAALKGSAKLAIGNVIGSNILNIFLILGITAVITPLLIQKNTLKYEIPAVVAVTLLLIALGAGDGSIGHLDGVILWVFMLLFLGYLFCMSKKAGNIEEAGGKEGKTGKKEALWKLIALTGAGGILIVLGSDVAVDSATKIAQQFGWSERLIGLTIIAFGTSLPELITSVTAGMKGKADIAIGNIVGSNIFNVLFVIGTAALITPVEFASNFVVDGVIAAAAAVILFVCVLKDRKLKKGAGILLLLCYGAYFVNLMIS